MSRKALVFALVFCMAFVFGSCGKRLSKDEKIERGKYLINACGVLSHHTPIGKDGKPDLTKFLGGSNIGYQGPWGVIYPKNLTPDIDTGIGAISNDEIKNIIREEGANGRPPLFYDYYKNLTEEDLDCIVEYLRNLTPVVNKVNADLQPGVAPKTPVINLSQVVSKIVTTPVKAPTRTTTKTPAKKTTKTPAKSTKTTATTTKKK